MASTSTKNGSWKNPVLGGEGGGPAATQFTTQIDGEDVYFIHVRSRHENALPLIITHGWPGSILEMLGVIGPRSGPGVRPRSRYSEVQAPRSRGVPTAAAASWTLAGPRSTCATPTAMTEPATGPIR